jgi:hypothetical protein
MSRSYGINAEKSNTISACCTYRKVWTIAATIPMIECWPCVWPRIRGLCSQERRRLTREAFRRRRRHIDNR